MLENFGVGIDIIDVTRFERIPIDENFQFYKKIFQESEINYCKNLKIHTHILQVNLQ